MLSLVLLLQFSILCLGLKDLPHHARGGLAYKQQLKFNRIKEKVGSGDQELWFTQELDHNNPGYDSFQQRYFMYNGYWGGIGYPVFFEIGGEGPAQGTSSGWIQNLAIQHKALMVTLEHRYYGESVPDDGLSNKLKYLSTTQALADVAAVIDFLKHSIPTGNSKFITFGGSYSGALSAWFRVKYPHLTAGSLSSSGVVNAIYNFTQFDTQVATAIGPDCSQTLRLTTNAFEQAIDAGRGNELRNLFGMSTATSNGDFFYMMADSAAMADQYGSKQQLCQFLVTSNTNPEFLIQNFANFTNTFWGSDFGGNCFYDSNCLKNTPANWQPTSRAWRWQKCSELAYFQSGPTSHSLRSTRFVNMEYNLQQCRYIFGSVIPNTNAANLLYGGADIQGTNIFFSDFSDDPWQQASVKKANNPYAPFSLVTCNGCGHCADFAYPSADDPAALTASRAAFESYLETWLQNW